MDQRTWAQLLSEHLSDYSMTAEVYRKKLKKAGYSLEGCNVCGGELPGRRTVFCSNLCALWWRDHFFWQAIARKIRKRDRYTCTSCGAKSVKFKRVRFNVHHIKPLTKGGFTTPSNLTTLCKKCHTEWHKCHSNSPHAHKKAK